MKNATKNYIARGRQVGKFDIVSFTVSLEAFQEIAHEYNGKMYVSFEISRLKEADEKGRTHALYQLVKEQKASSEVAEPKPTKKTGKK